jgi:hypothetical protein
MKAQTFIFVHDQYIVLDYLAAGKFDQLPDVQYVFLGQRPVDLLDQFVGEKKVIVARNLPNNIEHYPNLVAWTGWYSIARNGLITADIVNLFEYDVNLLGWKQPMASAGYFWHPYADSTWWNYNGIKTELRKLEISVTNDPLPMTSNYTLFAERINTFVKSLMESDLDPEHSQAGHIVERYCSAYFQFKVTAAGGLTHLYADSHGTQGRGDRYQDIKYKLL